MAHAHSHSHTPTFFTSACCKRINFHRSLFTTPSVIFIFIIIHTYIRDMNVLEFILNGTYKV